MMKFIALLLLCGLLGCKDKKRTVETPTPVVQTDTLPDLSRTPGLDSVNSLLSKLPGGWQLVTDSGSGWTRDALEYFVYTRRKTEPDYPYISRGDYNCDGQPDVAALVADSNDIRLAFLLSGEKMEWWTEDMRGAALSNMKKQDFVAMKDERELKVSLGCDAVEAEWFEKATQVIYWDGKKFQNVWTGD